MSATEKLRIVFMGTPEFAVASLNAILQAGYEVAAVITAPDKPAGRGMKFSESAVKKYALEHNIPVLQPDKLKNPQFLEALKNTGANLQVVVAFRMLPEVVWNMPPLGTINVHASLLPQYRGAAPINWAIINGEKTSGVTTFKLQHEIDTGNILLQQTVAIEENETAGTLHDKLKIAGADLIVKTLQQLENGTLKEQPQTIVAQGVTLHHAPKIFTETCNINWSNSAENIYNLVRGLSPHPAAFTTLQNKTLKIYSCKKEIETHTMQPGEYLTDNKTFLKFACSNGFIHATEIQLEGKKRMSVEDFLRGFRF